MKKPAIEEIEKYFNTVEELIDILKELPAGFGISPYGENPSIAVSYKKKAVYMDNPRYIEATIEELTEDNPDGVDIPEEEITPYQQSLVVVMGYSDLCNNGNEEAQLMGVYSTEDLANEAGTELVELGIISRYELEFPELDEFGWK